MACNNPNCDCHHREKGGTGFAVGVAVGAAAATLAASDAKTRRKAKAKFEQLVGDAAPEFIEQVKGVAGQIIDDIRDEEPPKRRRRTVKR